MSFSAALDYAILMKEAPGPGGVSMARRPLRPLRADDVLVRISRAAICGTDLHIIGWNAWAAKAYKPPFALGHEFSGIVLDRGPDAADIHIGDKVAAETHLACGHCSQCAADRGHTCLNLQVFSRLDCGAFAEFAVVPAPLLRVLPADLPHKYACLMEPLGIAVRAVQESQAEAGQLLVVGCGPIGLLAIAAAKAVGVACIIAMDLAPHRLELAKAVGADVLIDPRAQDADAQLRRNAQEGGVDAAVDTSGNQAGIGLALAAVKPGGNLVLAGLPEAAVSLDLSRHVILREVAIRGIYGRRLHTTWRDTIALLPALIPALDRIVTHEFPLDRFDEAFATAISGQAGKVQFVVND
ncbi:zinc-binding dehydrogenase [Pusillimonas sp. SM2304]|uniref:zinc-binding dehydrogenase n=1 Tax=Pusillimonas sp. SM2304 TaxID=3073241 RepID=UPI002875F8D2|nr:zinc-binding dehydrogenase [Pusillimonas sp. SM2304]MDS1140080.1 zinc-binding dehydrogenase [Pusillimonas sp. SM2304]